jgi:hypothetical protein
MEVQWDFQRDLYHESSTSCSYSRLQVSAPLIFCPIQCSDLDNVSWIYIPEKSEKSEGKSESQSEPLEEIKATLKVKIQLEWDAPSSRDSLQNQVTPPLTLCPHLLL